MRLLLVDGHYYLYRSFFAIRGLSNSRGEPTNAIYGFAKALRKMLVDLRPDRAAVIWDCGLPARRVALQPAYKQNRSEMPDDLRPQETWLQDKVSLFGPASLCSPDTEADDLIASYACTAAREGADIVIATNDKDILQLAAENIRIYSTAKADAGDQGFALLGTTEVRTKWGVDPARIADVLALTGDTSDNIPGVPGFGTKTAASLINRHGSLDTILAATSSIENPRLREKIESSLALIRDNREMVRLDTDLPLPVPWTELRITPRYPDLLAALRACEFRSLVSEIEKEAAAANAGAQGDLFA
ncbi:MAG: 5'-3' exonuclease H3TH domain-containing protein [Terrimicrobiaceae bacterium]|nr:5'-3' exonuclease H3TH domain-containing protein [Terrimicrobiaceae bacterium]